MHDLVQRAQRACHHRRLYRRRHRGPGGPGAGAPAAGDVHRRHRRARPASSGGRAPRQRHGRGGRRPRQLDRGPARGRRRAHGARQRPRHPDRPAPEVPRPVRARGHPDHAAFGRQVRGQGLSDRGRAARRRPVRGQRARRGAGGRGRAQPRAVAPELRARGADHPPGADRPDPEPPGHHDPGPAGPRDLRHGRAVQGGRRCIAWRAARRTCSAASRSAGSAIRSWWRAPTCRRARCSIFRPASRTSSRRRSPGAPRSPSCRSSAWPSSAMAAAGSSGRSPGRWTRSRIPASTATRCRPRRAAPTSRRCGAPCCGRCAPTAS